MSNSNCLEGMQCPNPTCLSYGPFRIEVSFVVMMHDDGSDYENLGGELTWDTHSWCECYECEHSGTAADFTTKETPDA